MKCRTSCLLTVALLALDSSPARSEGVGEGPWSGPVLVSPGGRGVEGRVGTGCPAFSWTTVLGTTGYDVVIYEVGGGAMAAGRTEDPALRAQIPAGATSFTPEAAECLPPGRYAWSVGARTDADLEPRWSPPAVFWVELAAEGQAEVHPSPPVRRRASEQVGAMVLAPPAVAPSSSMPVGTSRPRALVGELYTLPACSGSIFADVPVGAPYCSAIEQLSRDGITDGCGGGNYCPKNPVSREQLAALLERAMRGTATWSPAEGANVVAPPADNTATAVDLAVNDNGRYSSITIGADGLPIVSYNDFDAGTLKVMHCNDVACTGQDETISTVDDPANAVGRYTSITIGSDGLPIISYYDVFNSALKVAHCNDLACSGQDEATAMLDWPGDVGRYSSIAIGKDGLPIIAYYDDGTGGHLDVAHCNDVACAGNDESVTTVDDPGTNAVGEFASIVIGADGLPIISYYDATAHTLQVAHCNDVACTGSDETITAVDDPANRVGLHTSITIGADALPIISYQDGTALALKVAHCNDVACAGQDETITTVDHPASDVGEGTSITIGSDGLPIISYKDATAGALKVAHCNDVRCAGQNETITTLHDPAFGVGEGTSITIGVDGLPVVSYQDVTTLTLNVAHCSSIFCTPYFRRR